MEMFSKLSGMLLHALETREPTVNLLNSFIDHWKSITNYYIQTTDDSRPASQTDIPWRLRQMSDILVYEEKQQDVEDTGPCLEYLLQHKLLETLCTLGKAQYPPGMSQQVLLFFFKLLSQMQKPLLHTCEQDILVSTSVLCSAVRLVQSPFLLDQLLDFLLRTPSLMELLLQRCDHISDQISMVSLSLVDELLQKPHRDILDTLVLSFVQNRSYLSLPIGGQEDRQPESSDDGEDTQDLEDDPFFSDGFPDEHLAHHHHHHHHHQQQQQQQQQPAAPGSAADIVNSFLCLVPVQARSAHLVQEGGYESYVHDARTLVTQCQCLSLSWDWPQTLPPPGSSGKEGDFFEGHLLRVLFERLGRILQQPYELNLQLTAILSRLSAFNHPLLDEYLLDPYIHLSSCSRSLFSVLVRVMGELMQKIQQVSGLSERLLDTRRHLLGQNQHTGLEHLTLLEGIIVLEEFCKELAAIAFIKMPLDRDQQDVCTGTESSRLEST